MGLGVYRFRRREVRRRPETPHYIELELELMEPLSAPTCGRLLLEAVNARDSMPRRLLGVVEADVSRDRLHFVVGPVLRDTYRLDQLLAELPPVVGPARLALADYVLRGLIETLESLARQAERPGFQPLHGRLFDRSILVEPSGELVIIGGGFPGLTDFLLPPAAPKNGGHHFIAPEVLRGEAATVRSDMYSLGALLYQLVAQVPYRRELSELELRAAAFSGRGIDLPSMIEGVPDGLLDLIAWALMPDPTLRCESLETFRDELGYILRKQAFEPLSAARFAELTSTADNRGVDHGLTAFGSIAVDSPLDRPVPVLRHRERARSSGPEIVIADASPNSRPVSSSRPSSVVPLVAARTLRQRSASVVELDRRRTKEASPAVLSGPTVELPALELARLRELSVDELGPDTDASDVPLAAAFSEPLGTEDLGALGADYTGDLLRVERATPALPWLLLLIGAATGLAITLLFLVL